MHEHFLKLFMFNQYFQDIYNLAKRELFLWNFYGF